MIETKNDCYHYFDLNKISQWVIDTTNDKPNVTIESGMTEGGEFELLGQVETTNQNGIGVRGNLIMEMLHTLYDSGAKLNENNVLEFITDEEDLPIGTKIILNTLEVNGFMFNKMDVN
jgi:hypothetical protein